MSDALDTAFSFALLPIAALICTALYAVVRPVDKSSVSVFQHFASGVVISSVALELLPVSLRAGSIVGVCLGYIAGVAVLLAIDRFANKAGKTLPIAIDLFIDGLLLMIGFSAGEKGGVLLLLGLTLETTALGMVLGPTLAAGTRSRSKIAATLSFFSFSLLAGAGCGLFLPQDTGIWFAAIIGFGVAALLFLVVEELIVEAHEVRDTAFATASFFLGFLIPLVLAQVTP